MQELTKVAEIISSLGEAGKEAFIWWIASQMFTNVCCLVGFAMAFILIYRIAKMVDWAEKENQS